MEPRVTLFDPLAFGQRWLLFGCLFGLASCGGGSPAATDSANGQNMTIADEGTTVPDMVVGDPNGRVGDANARVGNTNEVVSDANTRVGDANESNGDGNKSIGDANAVTRDANGMTGDANGLGNTPTSDTGGAPSPTNGVTAQAGSSQYTLQSISCTDNAVTGIVPAYANANMKAPALSVQRAIVVLHGADRDAEFQEQTVLSAVAKAGGNVTAPTTLVIAPWFILPSTSLPDSFSSSGVSTWSDNGYMSGYNATGGAAISSFAAIDQLLGRFTDTTAFPALRSVFVIGHSAGGQTAQRYAVIGRGPRQWRSSDPTLRFAIANPSTYAYFTAKRPNASGGFSTFSASGCADFDQWKFGIKTLPTYFGGASARSLAQEYLIRDVTYVLGTADNDPNSASMDKSCCAQAQGNTRLLRGRAYVDYLKTLSLPDKHVLCEVPGVGHDTAAMLTSACVLSVLRQ